MDGLNGAAGLTVPVTAILLAQKVESVLVTVRMELVHLPVLVTLPKLAFLNATGAYQPLTMFA